MKRLANVVNDELELIETFGPATRPTSVVRPTSSVSAPPPNIS